MSRQDPGQAQGPDPGMDQDTEQKGFRLLGILDVQSVPCARESVLYGAGGGLALGLLHFLSTSRVRRSYDVGFAGFFITTLGSWFYCRLNSAKLRAQERVFKQGVRNKVLYQGTSIDPTTEPTQRSPPSAS
ncbi:unnamed protein product [Knipowitschia caucasica]|uniref:Cytochrome c oxidase assembly protein COX20, mitochondrial n=1 Tax=Knipowitschia caucasica TaxID=637954 RepID=A0AAV2JKH4_KNICA